MKLKNIKMKILIKVLKGDECEVEVCSLFLCTNSVQKIKFFGSELSLLDIPNILECFNTVAFALGAWHNNYIRAKTKSRKDFEYSSGSPEGSLSRAYINRR